MKKSLKRHYKHNIKILCTLGIIVAAFFAINVLIKTDAYFVLSKNFHSISKTSESLKAQIKHPISVTLYSFHPDTIIGTRALIERYQYSDIDIQFSVAQSPVPERINSRLGNKTDIIRIKYEDKEKWIGLNNFYLTENLLTKSIYQLLRMNTRWCVFVEGHGERSPFDESNKGYSKFIQDLRASGIQITSIKLSKVDQIPANTTLLIIASPQHNYLPKEVELIQSYVSTGGNLLWLSDPNSPSSLNTLSQDLGLKFQAGTIIDEYGRKLGTPHPAITIINNYPTHVLFENFSDITAFPWAKSITLDEQPINESTNPKWQAQPILKTAKKSWTITGVVPSRASEIKLSKEEELKSQSFGWELSRLLDFDGKSKNQRVIVIGDGGFLSNDAIDNYGNLNLGKRLINWLNMDDFLLPTISENKSHKTTIELNAISQFLFHLGYPFVLPLLLIVLALVLRHRARKAAVG